MATADLNNSASDDVFQAPALTEEHRSAIARILKNIDVPEGFWRELENALAIFRVSKRNRAKVLPRHRRNRWRRFGKHIAAAIAVLQEDKVPVPSATPYVWIPWAIKILEDIKGRAQRCQDAYDILSFGYNGQSKPHKEVFYATIMDLWVTRLRQEPSFSRPSHGGIPYGRVIDFFRVCLAPACGNAVPTETIAGIVERCRERYNDKGLPLKPLKWQRAKPEKPEPEKPDIGS
jgi:hypothetical protein